MAPQLRLVSAPASVGDKAAPTAPAPSAAEQRLVRLGLPMVEQCAGEIAREFRPLVQPEDLLGPGTLALYEAARTYREDEHPSFPIYARHHLRGRMLDAVHAEHFSLRRRVERAMVRGYDRFAGHQTVDVDLFSDPEEKIIDGTREGCDDALAAAFLAGILEAQGASAEEALLELEGQVTTFEVMRDAIDTLLPREREVIRLVYQQGRTLDEAAAEIRASARTAQRVHVSALGKLRAFLVWRGVKDPRLLDF